MAESYSSSLRTPTPGKEERSVLKFLDSLEEESKTVEDNVKKSWQSNLSCFRGQQWMQRNRAPLFKANKIGQIIRKKQAKLTEMKPQFQVQARRAGLATTSTVLQETIEAGWDEYSMQMVLEDLAGHLLIYGAGFLHIPWDSGADYGQGDIVPSCFDPRFVHIDPAVQRAQDLDQAAYIWTSSYMSSWDIEKRWPGRGSLVSPVTDKSSGSSVQKYLDKMFGAWKSGNFAVPEAIPRSEVREYWFNDPSLGDDGFPLYPSGRHIIRGGSDIILDDKPNPYHDERWPFVMIDGISDPEHPWGQSEVEALRRIQDAINRIGHIFVENAILTGNTWITADQQALSPTTMQRLSNIGAVIIEKAMGRTVERHTPPPMPPHMMEFIGIAMEMMDQLAGLSDTTASAQGRVEVRSDDQLEGLQQATEVLIRAMARRVEAGLERFGQRWIARIFQFYTRDRMLSYLGPTLEWQTFEFERDKLLREIRQATLLEAKKRIEEKTAQHNFEDMYLEGTKRAWRHFTYRITPGSSLASVRAGRAQLHMSLAQQGMISRKHALRDLGFANPEEEIDAARQEAMILGAQAQGQSEAQTPSVRRAV